MLKMAANLVHRILIVFFFVISVNLVYAANFGVLVAKSPPKTEPENFCIMYYPDFATLPETIPSDFVEVVDKRNVDLCKSQIESTSSSLASYANNIILSKPWNCSLADKAKSVQDKGAKALLVVTIPGEEPKEDSNSTLDRNINITVALISENSAARLLEMRQEKTSSILAVLFSPSSSSLDYGLLIIWLVAVFTVAVGSYWSGLIRQSLYNSELGKLSDLDNTNEHHTVAINKQTSQTEESALNISPVLITVFVICMGGLLLLLYFFFDYLVYAVIIVFAIGSMIAVYSCLEPLVLWKKCDFCKLPEFSLSNCMRCALDVREILLFAFAVSLSVTWFLIRRERYSWVLQDILGVAFSIHLLKSMRLPSLKICSLFLVLLFFYDIFFVFITPYLTVKGDSVMVEVATGGTSKEQVPMVLRVPHLRSDLLKICSQPYSLLGFGDILVPGLLVSYCHGIDMFLNNRKVYYITGCLAYGIGLIAAFLGFYFMSSAQPALLYLVPATLIPTILIGWFRGELNLLWNGVKVAKPKSESRDFNSGGNGRTEGHYGTTSASVSTPPSISGSPSEEGASNLVPDLSKNSLSLERNESITSDTFSQNDVEDKLLLRF